MNTVVLPLFGLTAVLAFLLEGSSNALTHSREDVESEDGWFVPQRNGNFKWISKQQLAELTRKYESRSHNQTVQFYLYTNDNLNNSELIVFNKSETLQNSKFKKSIPTVMTIHGWDGDYKARVNIELRDALFQRGKYNVISVDWSSVAKAKYTKARCGVEDTGKHVAKFIDFLHEEGGMSLSSLTLVGFSLGAHVAGFAGKSSRSGKIAQIIGLDPANPLIPYDEPEKRLSATDALYVESIQTCSGWKCFFLGFKKPIGKATFYANGGKTQPGCLIPSCSHNRAFEYYAEAILKNNFPAIQCDNYKDARGKECGNKYSTIRMGAPTNYLNASGIFYVPIDRFLKESKNGK